MIEQTLGALARQGISKEAYLQIAGKDEEELAHEAEPEAAGALRREAVLAAIIEAEQIEPSDDELVEALREGAQRDGRDPAELVAQLRKAGGQPDDSSAGQKGEAGRRAARTLESLREDVARRRAVDLLVSEATAITVEQAKAREKLWTPGKEDEPAGPGQIWTPDAR